MFNLFNLGHALPLRVRRFSCCRMSARGSARVRNALLHRQLRYLRDNRAHSLSATDRCSKCCVIRCASRCQRRFIIYEGHHHPA